INQVESMDINDLQNNIAIIFRQHGIIEERYYNNIKSADENQLRNVLINSKLEPDKLKPLIEEQYSSKNFYTLALYNHRIDIYKNNSRDHYKKMIYIY